MNKKERMYKQIENHGNNLKGIFARKNFNKESLSFSQCDPVKLSKKIHSLEVKAHKLATDYCNGENNVTTENWEELTDKILDKVDKILKFREKNIPVFVNGDARGYALKIEDDYVRKHKLIIHQDWGGYGILAPEFDGNN